MPHERVPLEELVHRIERFQRQLRQTRTALMAFVDHGTRWPRLPLAACVMAGSLAIPGTAEGGVPPPAADQVMHLYERLLGNPGALRSALSPDYEIGFDHAVYGPATNLPVPWDQVAAWAEGHPAIGVLHTQSQEGWHFAVIRLHGGFAYLVYTTGGEVAKLHLASHPEEWD